MAKKRHVGEQELPFVALMDTMTNVVGVLTIVLVMIGISLATAVNKIMSALPPVTQEQVDEAQARLDRMKAEPLPGAVKPENPANPEALAGKLAALDTELARLEMSARDKGVKLLDLESLSKEQDKREAELKLKKAGMDRLLAERDRIKALLDTTPSYKPPDAKVVRIPAGRPIPPDSVVEHILVTKDGVQWLDTAGAKNVFLREFQTTFARDTISGKVKRGKDSVNIYDHQKLARYIESRKLQYGPFRIEMFFADWTSSPMLRLTLTAASQMASRVSLQSTLLRIKNAPKSVVMFHVTSDGFENYLAARQICDQFGVPAGWDYSGKPEYTVYVPEIETNRPKKPPTKPAPPDVNEIKRPSPKLD